MDDMFVGPIVDGLIAIAPAGIDRNYREAPDGPPEDNSVIYPLKSFDITDQTNGKLNYKLTFQIMHVFRRTRLQDNLARIYPIIPGWIDALSAYPNSTLGGAAVSVNLISGEVVSIPWGGQNSIGLVLTVEVVNEIAIRYS